MSLPVFWVVKLYAAYDIITKYQKILLFCHTATKAHNFGENMAANIYNSDFQTDSTNGLLVSCRSISRANWEKQEVLDVIVFDMPSLAAALIIGIALPPSLQPSKYLCGSFLLRRTLEMTILDTLAEPSSALEMES